jgi:hypothetical protein
LMTHSLGLPTLITALRKDHSINSSARPSSESVR